MPQQNIIPINSSQILSKSKNDISGQWFQAILVCTGYANFYNDLKGEEDTLSLEDNLIL